jgi:hypothetical protein
MQIHTKQECYQLIAKAYYQGPHRNYDFNTYISTHQQAHQDLMQLNESVQKIRK